MRLGKEKAAGYVEDTGIETAEVSEVQSALSERIPVTPEPAPAVTAG